MRVAIMSDVHGFDLALEAVLADLVHRGPFEQVVVAGDLCHGGPGPARALELLLDSGATLLLGNTDFELVEAAATGVVDEDQRFALDQLGASGISHLAGPPFSYRVTPPQGMSPDDDLLVVHANPHDLSQKIRPEMSDGEIVGVLGQVPASAVAFGHHHVSFIRHVAGKLLVDISAVGNPRDGDLRARYGILTWHRSGQSWSAEIVRVGYPLEETLAEMRASRMPRPERAIARLLKASYER
jgi:predicted phosphodiesterase